MQINRLPIDHSKDFKEALGLKDLAEIASKPGKLPIEVKLRAVSVAIYDNLPRELRGVLALGAKVDRASKLVEIIEDFLEEAVRRYSEVLLDFLVAYFSARLCEGEEEGNA